MKIFKRSSAYIKRKLSSIIKDDALRKRELFFFLNIILALVSLFMSLVNIITGEYILMVSTLIFSGISSFNALLSKKLINGHEILYKIFQIECACILCFFIISGIPNGFSALWICMVPAFGLLVFGIKEGMTFSLSILAILVFLFWIPVGRQILCFRYTKEFMLRFPLFYVAVLFVSFLVEFVRAETQKKFIETEEEYKYLYRHDALTGIFNRYGFYEEMKRRLVTSNRHNTAVMIVDLDNFKSVNDTLGHRIGDIVLRSLADTMKRTFTTGEVFCRWGGEEFLIYMDSEEDYPAIAESLRKNVETESIKLTEDISRNMTVSIGVCTAPKGRFDLEKMIIEADECMYEAKQSGKNCVKCKQI